MSWFTKMWKGKSSEPPPEDNSPQFDKGGEEPIKPEEADEVLAEDNRSLLMQLISKNGLSIGMDLSKVPFPTFVLEPRSMLEKLGDIVIHPEHFCAIAKADSPIDRIVAVVRWYCSAYHKRPRGVKKPFNPVLGETFMAKYVPAGSGGERGVAVNWSAEQVSHHPPISAFYAADATQETILLGHYAPKSRFLGNSAASIGEGGFRLYLPGHSEVYFLTWPTVYARGILFGTLLMELGGTVNIRCPNTGLHADIEFVTKGYFSGTHNAVGGTIFRSAQPNTKGAPRDVLFTLEGNWHKQVFAKASGRSAEPSLLFDYSDEVNPMAACIPSPAGDTEPFFSRTLWKEVAEAVAKNQQDVATQHKTEIEEFQRKLRKQREEAGEVWRPRFFRSTCTPDDEAEQEFLGEGAVKLPAVDC